MESFTSTSHVICCKRFLSEKLEYVMHMDKIPEPHDKYVCVTA